MPLLLLTLVKSPEQPAGSHPPSSLVLVSYSGASMVIVVTSPASMVAASATRKAASIAKRTAVKASILVIIIAIDVFIRFVLLYKIVSVRRCRFSHSLSGGIFGGAG